MVAVETQGKAGGIARVSSYRLQYSVDCGAFNGVLDAAGNEAVRKHIIHIARCFSLSEYIHTGKLFAAENVNSDLYKNSKLLFGSVNTNFNISHVMTCMLCLS